MISGWRTADGRDPSLIPKLKGRTLILKDFTEVLDSHRSTRDEIYSIMRGAYDGSVEKVYGNGVRRIYPEVHFSVVAGVTQKIYAERSASLGERFLMLHIVKGNQHEGAEDIILRALENVGTDNLIAAELAAVAHKYLAYGLSEEELAEAYESCNGEIDRRIANLAQLVGMLRGQVDRDYRSGGLLYRAQYELGTRLAKQLKKLAIALAVLEDPVEINASVYRAIVRVALDTCIGFNREIVEALIIRPKQDIMSLNEITGIPVTTLRERLDDMLELEIVCRGGIPNPRGLGAPAYLYSLSQKTETLWTKAGLSENDIVPESLQRVDAGRKRR